MLLSDALGAVGSLFLLVQPARDLWLRARRERSKGNPKSPLAALRAALANDIEAERDSLSGYDLGSFSLGALLLFVSFVLKIFAL